MIEAAALLLTLAVPHVAPTPTSHRFMVFGEKRAWYLFDPASATVRPVPLPAGQIGGVACSADGQLVVATVESADRTWSAVRLDLGKEGGVKELVRNSGRLEEPAISGDGRWVYLTVLAGPDDVPMSHGGRSFAQVARVAVDGGVLSPVTSGVGCHYGAAVGGPQQTVAYVHAACLRPSHALEVMSSPGAAPVELFKDISARDLSMSLSGRRLVYAHIVNRSAMAVTLLELPERGRPAAAAEATAPRIERHPRPQIDADDRTVYFDSAGTIWRMRGGELTAAAALNREEP